MALFNQWQRSRCTLQWLIINVVGCFACFSAVALAQLELSEAVSGSVSFPDVALTCVGNLAVFMTVLMRGRLDMENGARDALATIRRPKLNPINPDDADVIMLSNFSDTPHSSVMQFRKYISHSHYLQSILLPYRPLLSAPQRCNCPNGCGCIEFQTTEPIREKLDALLPGTLVKQPGFLCRLLCFSCLNLNCHENNPEPLDAAREEIRREGERKGAVNEILESYRIREEPDCICIPVHPGNDDRWTKFLINFLKSKDKEARGIKVMASDALEDYITHCSENSGMTASKVVHQKYGTASLILPRLAEIFVNCLLTGWLRVDGFSSSLVARRAVRDHLVDSKGTGFAATAFLTDVWVKCDANKMDVCQALRFRFGLGRIRVGLRVLRVVSIRVSGFGSMRSVSYIVGCVNLICAITWSVLIAFEGKWYVAHSMPPSTGRVAVIIGAIAVALLMDSLESRRLSAWVWDQRQLRALDEAVAESRDRDRALAEVERVVQGLGDYDLPDVRFLTKFKVMLGNRIPVLARLEAWYQSQLRSEVRDQLQRRAEVDVVVHEPVGVDEDDGQGQVRFLTKVKAVKARLETYCPALVPAVASVVGYFRPTLQGQALLIRVGVGLEIACIVTFSVMLGKKMAIGRWIYSVMQVLVWIKWGIGSALLGDVAFEDEYGRELAPVHEHSEGRVRVSYGTWIYCSALLLNAVLAGVRGKWAY